MARRLSLQAQLGQSLRALRASRGWTQEEAAEEIEIAVRHYQKLEAGQVNATLHTLDKLCAAFGVDVARLFSSKA